MAAKKHEKAQPTGTVQARKTLEKQRQKAADQLRTSVANDTVEAQNATAKRLKDKPSDTRTIAPVDPNAGIL